MANLYVFHQGAGNSGELWYSVFDGTNWARDTRVQNVGMSGSPSALFSVEPRPGIYVFHQGIRDSGELWYLYFDPRGIATDRPDTKIQNLGMSASPSAVDWPGLGGITVFHQDFGQHGQLWHTYSRDGTNWGPDTRIQNLAMSASPSAVPWRGGFTVFHQDLANMDSFGIRIPPTAQTGAQIPEFRT